MRSYDDMRYALTAALIGAGIAIPIKWPNTPIEGGTPNNAMWARATIMVSGSEIFTLAGSDQVRGIFVIDVFVPKDSGNVAATQKADQIADALKRKRMKRNAVDVHTFAAKVSEMPDEEAWYGMKVSIDFTSFHPA
jgi:hypothetical protein